MFSGCDTVDDDEAGVATAAAAAGCAVPLAGLGGTAVWKLSFPDRSPTSSKDTKAQATSAATAMTPLMRSAVAPVRSTSRGFGSRTNSASGDRCRKYAASSPLDIGPAVSTPRLGGRHSIRNSSAERPVPRAASHARAGRTATGRRNLWQAGSENSRSAPCFQGQWSQMLRNG